MLGYRRQLDSLEQLKTYLEMLHLFPSPSCPQGFSPFFPVGAEAGKEAELALIRAEAVESLEKDAPA